MKMSKENAQRFARDLTIERLRQHLTQTQLAREVGLTQVSISQYESGSAPSLENLVKLCEFLKTLDFSDYI